MTATRPSVPRRLVGSSGWSYPEWRGGFYPADAKPADFLRLYAERLPAVELNATFYRLPSEAQFEAWAAQVPDGFRFAVKLSGAIAHGGRVDRLDAFCERIRALGDRLGPVLVELPEDRPRDEGFLRLLLDSLPPDLQVAVEPKHPSWAGVEVPVLVGSLEGEAPFRYLRLRDHPYGDEELAALAARIQAEPVDVYCFFNRGDSGDHSPGGEATASVAARLTKLLK